MADSLSVAQSGGKGDAVFLVHGWPDDGSVFDGLVEELKNTHRCYVVTLPYGRPEVPPPSKGVMGPSFQSLIASFGAKIDEVCKGEEKVTIISHDWGTLIAHGYEHRHPEKVKRMVTLDVGSFAQPKAGVDGVLGKLFVVAYQLFLITALLMWHYAPVLGKPIGNIMTTFWASFARAPQSRLGTVCAIKNYFYFHFWTSGRSIKFGYPQCPILFIWGKRKPFMFHQQSLLRHIDSRKDGSRYKGLECGHWVQRAKNFNEEVCGWLK